MGLSQQAADLGWEKSGVLDVTCAGWAWTGAAGRGDTNLAVSVTPAGKPR